MYNILIPITSDDTLARRQLGAISDLPLQSDSVTVTLLYVFEELDSDMGGTVSMKEYSEVPETVEMSRERLTETGFDVNALVTEGNPENEIISVAREQGADHVVLSGRRRSPAGKVIFGSVTQSVILTADVPVTVVPEPGDGDGEG